MSEEPEGEDEESRLFREAMRDVRRLAARERLDPARRPAPAPARARARFSRAGRAAAQLGSLPLPDTPAVDREVGGADTLSFRRPGVQESVLRRLRRGEPPVADEIDLHGLTAAQADAELRRFLAAALTRGLRCVRIVHGKGHRSGERGPVLKAAVNSLLRRSPAVRAFVSAPPRQGGTGATCVLLAPV